MQTSKTHLATYLAAGIMGSTAVLAASPAVAFDPSASAAIEVSNMYLWRGTDLGTGDAMVAGTLELDSGVGAYAGVWAASGDSGAGQEYDLYAGYGLDITDDVSVDLSVWNYIYPSQTANDGADLFADLSEVILSVNAYGASFSYYDNVAGAPGYTYLTAGYGAGPFSVTLGQHNFDSTTQGGAFGEDMTHLDLGFQFNDELSFTASTIVSSDEENATPPDTVRRSTLFQVVYSKSFDL